MNRRKFLTHAGAAAAAATIVDLGFADLGFAQPARTGCPPSGVQLYTVRDALQRDVRAALARLREIGIAEGELYGLNGGGDGRVLGLTPAELKRAFDDSGLRVPYSHIDGALTNSAATADLANALGVSTVIVALPSEFSQTRDGRFAMLPLQTRAQLDQLVDKLNRVGREYRQRGLVFGYHNHHVEFMPIEGVVPYDYMMERTDPALVKIELDLGWVALSGNDPVAYLRKYSGRVIGCHLKDYDARIAADVPQQKLVEPGAGGVDFGAVLAAMRDANVPHGFIEIDVTADPFGAVERGHRHLDGLRSCA
jgi:sugar phosphate isomerase/epimerase